MDKTGLAIEAAQIFTEKDGVSAVLRTVGAVKITDVKVREKPRVSALYHEISRRKRRALFNGRILWIEQDLLWKRRRFSPKRTASRR